MIIVIVLSGCGMSEDILLGGRVHGFYVKVRIVKWDVYVGSAFIDVYCQMW